MKHLLISLACIGILCCLGFKNISGESLQNPKANISELKDFELEEIINTPLIFIEIEYNETEEKSNLNFKETEWPDPQM